MKAPKARDRLAQAQRFLDEHWQLIVSLEWHKLVKQSQSSFFAESTRFLEMKQDFLGEKKRLRQLWRSAYADDQAWQQQWLAAKSVHALFRLIGSDRAQQLYPECDRATQAWLLACQLVDSLPLGDQLVKRCHLLSQVAPLVLAHPLPARPRFVDLSLTFTRPLPSCAELCRAVVDQALEPLALHQQSLATPICR